MNTTITTRSVLRLVALSASILAGPGSEKLMGQSAVSVPPDLQVPEGNQAFLNAAARGTQNYLCMPSGWTFIGPQATLFVTIRWINGNILQQVATHYLSPNPAEGGTARPTWQSSFDSSVVWAKPIASSTDPKYVDPTAIPWLKLEAAGGQSGPTGGSSLSETTFIQRVNTSGGLMPTTACTVGARAFVPYTADYVFYKKSSN